MESTTIYFIGFSDGIVKVGRTSNFRTRFSGLRSEATKRSAYPTHSWSMEHGSARIAEHMLLRTARGMFGQPFGAEYFTAEFGPFVDAMIRALDERAGIPIIGAIRDSLQELRIRA